MTSYVNTTAAAAYSFGSAIFGNKLFTFFADTTSDIIPIWIKEISGPTGTVVCMAIALRWMTSRLDKQEVKWDAQEKKRDEDRLKLLDIILETKGVIIETKIVIIENTEHIKTAKHAMLKCPGSANKE